MCSCGRVRRGRQWVPRSDYDVKFIFENHKDIHIVRRECPICAAQEQHGLIERWWE